MWKAEFAVSFSEKTLCESMKGVSKRRPLLPINPYTH